MGPPAESLAYRHSFDIEPGGRLATPMLLWAGLLFVTVGVACIGIDRPLSHYFYDHVGAGAWRFLNSITHFAKASHWLIASVIAYGLAWLVTDRWGPSPSLERASQAALAFVASLVAGSIILHGIKLVLGRRRPRDDLEMGLYGFMPLSFDRRYNSFPSGHSLTILCVAVIATALCPMLAPLWFAAALGLAMTRALLSTHYLSDVLVGAGLGLLSAREVLLYLFPTLALSWF